MFCTLNVELLYLVLYNKNRKKKTNPSLSNIEVVLKS